MRFRRKKSFKRRGRSSRRRRTSFGGRKIRKGFIRL